VRFQKFEGEFEMKFGIELGSQTIMEMVEISKLAEEMGFSSIWLADHAPATKWRDPFIAMAAIGLETEKIRLGCGVANPYSRYAALTGITAATLVELCGERIVLGIGAGGTLPLKPLEIEMWHKPVTAVRESIEMLRELFKGGLVDYKGKIVTLKNTQLFKPVSIPLHIGTRGPALSKLAGEIADGIILNPPLKALPLYHEKVREGLQASGRDNIEIVEFLPVYISESKNLDPVKPIVALLLPTTPAFALEILGLVEIGRKISEVMMIDRPKGAEMVPDDLVTGFAIAGDTKQCINQIEALKDEVDELVCLAFGSTSDVLETVKILGNEIIPSF
jgi:5,10-methylenetetrahydromethanopterin reductase